MDAQTRQIKMIKQRYEKKWMQLPGVVGVGIGRIKNRAGIIISVSEDFEEIHSQIPGEVEGVPTEIQHSGNITAQ